MISFILVLLKSVSKQQLKQPFFFQQQCFLGPGWSVLIFLSIWGWNILKTILAVLFQLQLNFIVFYRSSTSKNVFWKIFQPRVLKPWSNGLASSRKLKTWVYLRLRLAGPCVHLRWLAITLVEIKFARKSMQVFYRLTTQRKSLRKFNLPLLASPFDQGFQPQCCCKEDSFLRFTARYFFSLFGVHGAQYHWILMPHVNYVYAIAKKALRL